MASPSRTTATNWLDLSEVPPIADALARWFSGKKTAELSHLCRAMGGFSSSSRAKLVDYATEAHAWMSRYRTLCSSRELEKCKDAYLREATDWLGTKNVRFDAWSAAAHVVQQESGSLVRVGKADFLTCAHCVCHDDDPDEDDAAECAAVQCVGRLKLIVTSDGEWAVAQCIHADASADLALLRVLESRPSAGAPIGPPHCLRIADEDGSRAARIKVVCVGNPSAFDLESDKAGAEIAFSPPVFHTSTGYAMGPTAPDRLARLGLGPLRHTAWTYWGHSGAGLVGPQGQLLGLHNSWDADKGTRHGVDARSIRSFLSSALSSRTAAPAAVGSRS